MQGLREVAALWHQMLPALRHLEIEDWRSILNAIDLDQRQQVLREVTPVFNAQRIVQHVTTRRTRASFAAPWHPRRGFLTPYSEP